MGKYLLNLKQTAEHKNVSTVINFVNIKRLNYYG